MVACKDFIHVKKGQTAGIPADVLEALQTRSCVTRRGVTYVTTEAWKRVAKSPAPLHQAARPEDVPIRTAGWIW